MTDLISVAAKNQELILSSLGRHIFICAISLFFGILVAVPLGILLTYHKRAASVVLTVLSVVNTIPSIVLLGVAMILFGLGIYPAVVVLFLYSLLPIVRATYTGILDVDPKYIKAARGMGMSRIEILRIVQLPLSLPSIITGIRLSAIYIISWATLAAFIGGGGLGDVIWMGLQSYNFNLVICGAVPATLLAFIISWVLNRVIRLTQKHVSREVQ